MSHLVSQTAELASPTHQGSVLVAKRIHPEENEVKANVAERPGTRALDFFVLFVTPSAIIGVVALVVYLEYLGATGFGAVLQFFPPFVSKTSYPTILHTNRCVGASGVRGGWAKACFGRDATLRHHSDSPIVHVTTSLWEDEELHRLYRATEWAGGRLGVWRSTEARARDALVGAGGTGGRARQLLAVARELDPQQLILSSASSGTLWLRTPAAAATSFDTFTASASTQADPAMDSIEGSQEERRGGRRQVHIVLAAEPLSPHATASQASRISGAFILGRAGAVSQLLQAVPCSVPGVDALIMDDQACFTLIAGVSASNASLPRVAVDTGGALFHFVRPDATTFPLFSLAMAGPNTLLDALGLAFSPSSRAWVQPISGNAPSFVHTAGVWGATLRVWEVLQGRNNAQCGAGLCCVVYAGHAVMLGIVLGMFVGLAWERAVSGLVPTRSSPAAVGRPISCVNPVDEKGSPSRGRPARMAKAKRA